MLKSVARFTPGLAALLSYDRHDAPGDLKAGLAVAAVALPVAIAYAELAGFPPEYGLYSSVLPLVAYAVFGSSRQLVVGPDAATCALVLATLTPLAAGDAGAYVALSVTFGVLTGLICIAASFLRLGVLADFLSKPILVGFLNGIAISIVLGQAGKILGFSVAAGGILSRLSEIAGKVGQTHLPTFAVALGSFAILALVPRVLPWLPAAICAMVVAGAAVALLGLEAAGVKTLGPVPGGLPSLHLPEVDLAVLPGLLPPALGLALISFSSLALTARSFASRNGYEVDLDQDFAALGAANIGSALSSGFVVSGADSRTAMSESAGGRTHATGLVAAVVIVLALLFLTEPLRHIPIATLGAVLIVAALSLVDIATLRLLYQIHPAEMALSLLATVGVVVLGVIDAILLAVVLALIRFIKLVARPMVESLGEVPGMPGFHSLARHPTAVAKGGLLLFRFNGPIVFFNTPYFRRELFAALERAGPGVHGVVIDLIPVSMIDGTGLLELRDIRRVLAERSIALYGAGRATEWELWRARRGLIDPGRVPIFPTLESALDALVARQSPSPALSERG